MPEPFNPFHSWLGLKPNITNPHHFQLLGVSPRLTEADQIAKAVAVGVKQRLASLSEVPLDGKTTPVVKKLKARIAAARKTLLDPKLRQAYKLKLTQAKGGQSIKQSVEVAKSQIAPSEMLPPSSKPTTAPSSPAAPPVASSAPPSATAAPSRPVAPEPPIAQAPPAIAAAATPTASVPAADVTARPVASPATVANASQNIPAAIPLAVPLSSEHASPAAVANPIENSGSNAWSDSESSPVSIQKAGRRRGSKLLGPLMFLLMTAVGGGGAFLIYQNFDAIMRLAKVDPDSTKVAPGVTDGTKSEANTSDDPPKKLNAVDLNSIPELDVDKVMSEAGSVTLRTEEEERALAAELAERDKDLVILTPEETPDDNDATGNKEVGGIFDPEMNPNAEPAKQVPLTDWQLARVRKFSERAHRNIYRRNFGAAESLLQLSSAASTEEDLNGNTLIPAHQALVENIADAREMMKLARGFWQQVHNSAEQISGAQEIIIGKQIVAFVESRPRSVLVRRAGSNIEYHFDWCPPGLALAIGEQGAVTDIPTWNKQKAAIYAIDQLSGMDHQRRIEQFLGVAEEAGHDCSAIRRFSKFDFENLGVPNSKVDLPKGRKLNAALQTFRDQVGYDRISKLTSDEALEHSKVLLAIDSPNFEQQAAILEETRLLGIQSGYASVAEDAILDLNYFANIDLANLMCETFEDLCKGKKSTQQVRDLMERAIPYLNSTLAESADIKSKSRLLRELVSLAEKFQMRDAYRRLEQVGN